MRKSRQVNIKYVNHNPDNKLIIIKGVLENGRSLKILVDSASQAELISESVAMELNKSMENSDMELKTAQGAKIEILGQVKLNLQIAGHDFDVTTQVVPALSEDYDCIFGIGFMNSHETSLKTKPGYTPMFCIDGMEIPILQEKNHMVEQL